MNVERVEEMVRRFVARHHSTLSHLSGRQSQILELAATVGVSEHYKAAGYDIEVVNPGGGETFTVKTSTRGHPSKYSRIHCVRNGEEVEIHMNTMVRSGHDQGTYCVDVAMVKPGRIPRDKKGEKWVCLANTDLISFAEAKRLVVYPMLLAQFIGIVHEVTPQFLSGEVRPDFGQHGHLPPSLIALGHFSSNAEVIKASFEVRGFLVRIAENFDIRLAVSRKGERPRSPFYSDAFEPWDVGDLVMADFG